ncbi:MAG: divalent-cation tolerance protein CutA [Deltaproteobacteria bacterium]|jgi:periplasmic divalent cation tolerance protein|nr:divalent-cation tolerance protein CutA [Deltaproteobacteria bacterium]
MARFIQVVTTTDSRELAERIARSLVGDRLAACVQIDGPMTSIYHWRGKMEEAEEWRLTAKSRAVFFDDIAAAIRRVHSYEVPEIIATEIVGGDETYLRWLEEETRPGVRK